MVAAALVATVLGVPMAGADDLKDKRNRVKKDIRSAQSDLHSSSAAANRANARLTAAQRQLAGAQVALAAAEAKVSVAERRDVEMQGELDLARSELRAARKALRQGRAKMAVQRVQVAATITDYYQQGDPALIAFASLMDAQSPADLTRQSEMRDAIVDREANSYQELLASKVILDVNETQVEQAKDEVAVKRQAAAEHLEAMEGLEQEASAAKAAVSKLVSQRASASASAAQAKAADQRELGKLKAEEDKIATMLRRRAAQQQASRSASRSAGVLAWPVKNARLSSPYGFREHPIYGYWGMHDGQDWAADCGSPLYATASGKVASKYFSAVYGNRLVLDHGILSRVGVASVYNHATHYTVGVGARVQRGQVIGYVGSTGWSTGCHLHFSVLVNGRTVDPRKWF